MAQTYNSYFSSHTVLVSQSDHAEKKSRQVSLYIKFVLKYINSYSSHKMRTCAPPYLLQPYANGHVDGRQNLYRDSLELRMYS